ncbi:condensation domain-containing protein [Streptomyces echinatus]|uniref:condensation domain-containing protein n=1 Tax=Streptomyces echinatus TaxID=67293 RepID=UPI003CD0BB45
MGFFVNTWVLRVNLQPDDTFTDTLTQVREKALAAYANQDAPFEQLVELLNPTRTTATTPSSKPPSPSRTTPSPPHPRQHQHHLRTHLNPHLTIRPPLQHRRTTGQ